MRVGYACINLELKEHDIYSTRTLIIDSIEKKGIAEAKRLALLNINDLAKIFEHNESIGIRFFRLTSNLFPHMENPRISHLLAGADNTTYNIEFARTELAKVGKIAREYGHRITAHPGQYAQLGTPREEVFEQTVRDLTLHAQIFAAMGLEPKHGSVMIIHGGGVFGDKLETLERWKKNFRKLPLAVAQYIAVENDEHSYSVLDLLPVCEELGVPLCVDFFHHSVKHVAQFDLWGDSGGVNGSGNILQRVLNTWKLRGIKPKCHWSQQRANARPGTHDDCVDNIPPRLLKWCVDNYVDIMLEVKHKDKCAMGVLERQFVRVEHKIDGKKRVEWVPNIFPQ
jgi:UV DNA damage endonuclease